MCTVSFLPLPGDGFILTSNRDEWAQRKPAIAPRRHQINGKYVFFPQDQQAGGTWIATCEFGYTLCLLNGGFEAHHTQPPYRLSRGKMLLDFYFYDGLEDFRDRYDFTDIEAFTLLIINSNQGLHLDELRWDGETLHHTPKSIQQPHIWSSVTLYSQTIIQQRRTWFAQWLKQYPVYTQEDILHFHEFGGDAGAENDLVMNRENKVLTCSITSIQKDANNHKMTYRDLQKGQTFAYRILQSMRSN